MTKIKPQLIVVLLTTILMLGCKKEDGQSISIGTKKGKLSRHWTMSSGNLGIMIYHAGGGPPDVLTFELNGSTGIVTNGQYAYGTLKYTLSIEFDKKGRIFVSESLNGDQFTASGRWDFGNGIGDRKKKQDIYIQLDNVTAGNSQDHYFNHFSPELCYDIEKITKDEIRIHAFTDYYMVANGDKGTIETTFTFRSI
jgi:hypothetical protein